MLAIGIPGEYLGLFSLARFRDGIFSSGVRFSTEKNEKKRRELEVDTFENLIRRL